MSSIRNTAAATAIAVAAAALLAACGSSGAHGTAAAAGAAPSAGASAPAKGAPVKPGGPGGSGTTLPSGPLTMAQAGHVYLAIIGPGNALAQTVARDGSGSTPYRRVRADLLAYANELRAEIGKLQGIRWPSQVQPHVTAIVRNAFPAFIGCLQAEAAAGSASAAQAVTSTNRDCMAADNATIPSSLTSAGG